MGAYIVSFNISHFKSCSFSVAAHFMSKFTAETVKKNHKTRLKCEAIGDKPISITWMKDKVNIKPESDSR